MVTRRPSSIVAIAVLVAAGCGSPSVSSADSMERIQALQAAGASGQLQRVAAMLPSLSSEDPLVRWNAQRALLTLTGTTNGYDWAADRPKRAAAIDAWIQWCKDRGVTPTGAQ